jgi:hypothetical protein
MNVSCTTFIFFWVSAMAWSPYSRTT